MARHFLGFGNGSDGAANLSGTDAPIDSTATGTSGTTSLTATNASFTSGQIILIIQMRGANAGSWELNQIDSYVAGTITTVSNLENTYNTSGDDAAQVIVIPQYSEVVVDSGNTYTAKSWDGSVGGIIVMMCSGKVDINGTISADSKGFRGGLGAEGGANGSINNQGYWGESSTGPSSRTLGVKANNGAGGGGATQGSAGRGGGGGGGFGTVGQDGEHAPSAGEGGDTDGNASLTDLVMAGGGGGGGTDWPSPASNEGGDGGRGGGLVVIFAYEFEVDNSTGIITCDGANGGTGASAGGGGGAGAGGGAFIKAVKISANTTRIACLGGTGGISGDGVPAGEGDGGDGGDGRVRLEACTINGTTNPSASESEGGHTWCGSLAQIVGG